MIPHVPTVVKERTRWNLLSATALLGPSQGFRDGACTLGISQELEHSRLVHCEILGKSVRPQGVSQKKLLLTCWGEIAYNKHRPDTDTTDELSANCAGMHAQQKAHLQCHENDVWTDF